jgi:hypothetical protein
MNVTTVEEIVQGIREVPSRLTNSFDRLTKMFNASEDEVREAKKLYKESLLEEIGDFTSKFPDSSKIERAWVNNQGKVSVQLRFEQEKTLDISQTFIPRLLPVEVKEGSNVLMVYLSDKHIGAAVHKDAMLGNHYDRKVFEERMQATLNEIVDLESLYQFSKIIIFDMGDAIDGQDGLTGSKKHLLPQNMDTRMVYEVFMQTHLDFFNSLKTHLSCPLEFRTVGESNHGGDLEWVLNKALALQLENMGIYCNVGNKFIEYFTLGDHCFMISHGKDWKDMKFGLPYYLDTKTELYIRNYMSYNQIDSKFVHFIKGDLHRSNSEYGEFLRYKNVLSLFGSSKWLQTNFMSNIKGVSMDILNLKKNTVTEHNLFL